MSNKTTNMVMTAQVWTETTGTIWAEDEPVQVTFRGATASEREQQDDPRLVWTPVLRAWWVIKVEGADIDTLTPSIRDEMAEAMRRAFEAEMWRIDPEGVKADRALRS